MVGSRSDAANAFMLISKPGHASRDPDMGSSPVTHLGCCAVCSPCPIVGIDGAWCGLDAAGSAAKAKASVHKPAHPRAVELGDGHTHARCIFVTATQAAPGGDSNTLLGPGLDAVGLHLILISRCLHDGRTAAQLRLCQSFYM